MKACNEKESLDFSSVKKNIYSQCNTDIAKICHRITNSTCIELYKFY